jgi:copper transport protein
MKRLAVVAALLAALVAPAAASAHAYLVKTVPQASVILTAAPPAVELTFDEAVEPRFAVVSVSDVNGRQVTDGGVLRSSTDADTLLVPLKRVPEGWYLVYWRAISVDGHPVQGAFTFALGPNAGPPPEFVIPDIAQTATSTPLLVARWLVFLTVLTAIGMFVLRILVAHPVVRRVDGTSLDRLSLAAVAVSVIGLLAIPAYVEESTAVDSLRSFWAFGALVPLWRVTAFGRAYVDLWICFALFSAAAWIALWLDRPRLPRRPVASILATTGALLAAAALLAVPGAGGHAAQTSPRGVAVFLDWLHLLTAAVWVGGLVGLLVLWWALPAARRVAGLVVCVPRFSNVALVSVLLLLGTGVGASVLHLPAIAALWQTSYGETIVAKAAILAVAAAVAAGNLLRAKPRLSAVATAERAARLLRRLVGVEAVLVAGAVFAGALLSSLAPPPPAFAKEGSALARVGPGPVAATVHRNGYTLRLLVHPNKAVQQNAFALELTRNGQPVRGATVTLGFSMLDMAMPDQSYAMRESAPGIYTQRKPALVMVGHWGLELTIAPKDGAPFSAFVVDRANG